MGINTCIVYHVYHVYHVYVRLSVQSNHFLTLQHKQFQSGLVDSVQKPHNLILEGSNWTWTGWVTSHPKQEVPSASLMVHPSTSQKSPTKTVPSLILFPFPRISNLFIPSWNNWHITIPVGTFLLWMILPAFPARWNMLVSFERWAIVATCWQAAAASYDVNLRPIFWPQNTRISTERNEGEMYRICGPTYRYVLCMYIYMYIGIYKQIYIRVVIALHKCLSKGYTVRIYFFLNIRYFARFSRVLPKKTYPLLMPRSGWSRSWPFLPEFQRSNNILVIRNNESLNPIRNNFGNVPPSPGQPDTTRVLTFFGLRCDGFRARGAPGLNLHLPTIYWEGGSIQHIII